MTTYTTIPDTDVDQDSPLTVTLLTALRDNLPATMELDSTAPKMAVDADRSASATADYDGMDDFSGCRFFAHIQGSNSTSGTVKVTISYSTDGVSFSGDTDVFSFTVSGNYTRSCMGHIDFASGNITASCAAGTMSGASTSITHIRIAATSTGGGSRTLQSYVERTGGAA